jgi:phage terminase large subunit-like protein
VPNGWFTITKARSVDRDEVIDFFFKRRRARTYVEAVGVLDDAATQLLRARENGGPARQLIIRSVEGKKGADG